MTEQRENFRDVRFTFELDGEQAMVMLAAVRTHAKISDRADVQELNEVLDQQYREQGGQG